MATVAITQQDDIEQAIGEALEHFQLESMIRGKIVAVKLPVVTAPTVALATMPSVIMLILMVPRQAQPSLAVPKRLARSMAFRRKRHVSPSLKSSGWGTWNRVCALCGYWKRFAGAGSTEEAQAFEVVAPVKVVDAVAVIVQLDGVVLPEPQPGAPVLKLHKLETERVVLPWVVPGDTVPAQFATLIEVVISMTGLKSPAKVQYCCTPTSAKEDATFTMPPSPSWYLGREAIGTVLTTQAFAPLAQNRWHFSPTRVNGCPAFAVYHATGSGGTVQAFGIQVVTMDDGASGLLIADVTTFLDPSLLPFFGFPPELPR